MSNWKKFWDSIVTEDAVASGVAANNVGGHQIAGTFGDPPIDPKKRRKLLRYPVNESTYNSIKFLDDPEKLRYVIPDSIRQSMKNVDEGTYFAISHPKTGEALYINAGQAGIGRQIIGTTLS